MAQVHAASVLTKYIHFASVCNGVDRVMHIHSISSLPRQLRVLPYNVIVLNVDAMVSNSEVQKVDTQRMTDSAENYTHRVLCYTGGKHSNGRLVSK